MTIHPTKSDAQAAALATLGDDATEGVDFILIANGSGWLWTGAGVVPATSPPETTEAPPAKMRRGEKRDLVVAVLRHPAGATMGELMLITGWGRDTVRGFLWGALKKRNGLPVTSADEGDGAGKRTVYRIKTEEEAI